MAVEIARMRVLTATQTALKGFDPVVAVHVHRVETALEESSIADFASEGVVSLVVASDVFAHRLLVGELA